MSLIQSSQRSRCLGAGVGSIVAVLCLCPAVTQGPRERPRLVLRALDLDQDGSLSDQEVQAAPVSLRSLDRNGDGELTTDEMEAMRSDAGASPDQLVTQLMSFDKDRNSVLTQEELPERMRAMFGRADKNHDGKLTAEELRATALHSGSPNGPRLQPGKAQGMIRLDPVLSALDADHDGVISSAEIEAAGAHLAALDTDHNGRITPEEMRVRQQSPAERVAHVLDEFDTNKDGKLSREEAPDGLRPRLTSADTNGDGVLDSAELLAMFSAAQKPSPDTNNDRGSNSNRGSGQPTTEQPKGRPQP